MRGEKNGKNNSHIHWPARSAGLKMTGAVPSVFGFFTIGETRDYLKDNIKNFSTIGYIYVIDAQRKLTGVISIRDLYRRAENIKIKSISEVSPLVKISPTAPQEYAAYLALQHNIKAVPVVDKKNILIGVIPNDEILKILHRDMREDFLHLAGIHRAHIETDNILEIPLSKAIRHRLPWLFVGLLGGVIASKIVGIFENTLEQNIILASFIPLVVYIADAIGTQLEAFTIRDLAIFRKFNPRKYLAKQFLIVASVSVILGASMFLITPFINLNTSIAVVLCLSIIGASLASLFTGVLLPFIFRKLCFDPANASGPIGTILQDITSVLIYFLIASVILNGGVF